MTACASGCVSRGRHLDECVESGEDGACSGCLPRLATDRLAVCCGCLSRVTRALPELPGLWVDLGERPQTKGASGGSGPIGGTTPEACPTCDNGQPCNQDHREAPAPMGPENLWIRSDIRAHLAAACRWLTTTAHVTLPDETDIVRTTRSIAVYESGMAAQERLAYALAGQPNADGTKPSPEDVAAARETHKAGEGRRLQAAAVARWERETGLDIIRALAEHVTRHLDTILTDPAAGPRLVIDLSADHRDARRRANRSRGDRITIACTCGGRVLVDKDAMMFCPDCGEEGVLSWWIARAPVLDGPMTLVHLRDWLLTAHGRDIKIETLRTWSKPRDERSDPLLPSVGRDDRGRKLYDPLVAAALIRPRTDPIRHTA